MSMPATTRRAISLVDTLYVIGIIAVITAVMLPVFAKARESAESATSMSGYEAANLARSLYAQDYDGVDADLIAYHAPRFNNWLSHGPGGGRNPMVYHGGPLILGTTNAYYIWYGNWSGNSATTILTDLANNIGGSPYFNINTTYYNGSNVHVSNSVHYGGSTTVGYTFGTSLSDSQIQQVVANAIGSNALQKDTNGVYFVLTSADVTASSGFCTQYCGWHTHGTVSGSDIKYAFVGNPDRCPSACEAQTIGPNGNAGADGMASIITHELEEAVTDPDLNAWFTRNGAENADLCAWTFGSTSTAGNGSQYNMTLGTRNFLIQQNWVNSGRGFCAKSF